jgi:hypothetical protein
VSKSTEKNYLAITHRPATKQQKGIVLGKIGRCGITKENILIPESSIKYILNNGFLLTIIYYFNVSKY